MTIIPYMFLNCWCMLINLLNVIMIIYNYTFDLSTINVKLRISDAWRAWDLGIFQVVNIVQVELNSRNMAPDHFVLSPSIKHYQIIINRKLMHCDGIPVVKKRFSYVYCKLCFLIISGVKGGMYQNSVIKLISYVRITEMLFISNVVIFWCVKRHLNRASIYFKLFVCLSLFRVIFARISINRSHFIHLIKQRYHSYWFD